ncbi:MAG: Metal-sensitive transcriptional repressor [Candidatus Parcubacteria bacterium]|jgi:DNA-binding FrmR family transcriptional regulator
MDSAEVRINRVIGQLKGIAKMISEERDCTQVLQQIAAVKKAIDGLTKELVVSDICKYVPKEKTEAVKNMVEQAIKL